MIIMETMNKTNILVGTNLNRIIGWTNFSYSHSISQYMDFVIIFNISLELSSIYFAHFSGC